MKIIEIEVPLPAGRMLTVPIPATAEPGDELRVRLTGAPHDARLPRELPQHHVGPWPQNLSLRREDLYGDDGR